MVMAPASEAVPGLHTWDDLDPVLGPALVCGNGPSLLLDAPLVEDFRGLRIACNTYWRFPLPPAEWLVCFDAPQVWPALEMTAAKVLVPPVVLQGPHHPARPERPSAGLPESTWRYLTCRIWQAAPWLGRYSSRTDPLVLRAGAWGNFSGMLAFQLAWRLRCNPIFLYGMDCSGITHPGTGQVRISAADPSWNGYSHADLAASHCEDVAEGWAQPRGWVGALDFWRTLTAVVRDEGTEVYRVSDSGALSWLEVKSPQ